MTNFSICETPDILRIVYFIKIIINIVKIVIPIFLIVIVTMEFAKGVVSGEKKNDKILKNNANKILSAILIFTIPTIINFVLEVLDKTTNYESCWVNANSDTIKEYQLLWDLEEEKKKEEDNSQLPSEEIVDGDVANINKNKKPIKLTDNISKNYYSTFTYYLYLPDKVVKNLPIVVYIPGLGARGNDYNSGSTIGIKDGPLHEVRGHGYSYNAIIISMQVPSNKSAYQYVDKYIELIDKIANEFEANMNKISVIGFSNGCYGLLTMISKYPKYFSAAVPIGCSPANYNANKFIYQPVWTFVGGGDGYREMPTFVSKINSLGGNAKHTYATREDGTAVKAHGIMNDSYSILREERYDIINWMISQTKKS